MGILADRVEETTNTTGTGTLTLAGAVSKYQAFSAAFSTGAKVEYVIESGTDWEVGLGTYTTSGTTLSRDIIRRSSNSGSAITVAAGAKVWSDLGADNFTSSVQPFRNRIYNGQFRFDQVKEGSAYSVSGATVQGPDGWTGVAAGAGTFTMTRVADPDNASLFALKLACTVADASIGSTDNYYVTHAIEGYDTADLRAGKSDAAKVTLSFDTRMGVTGEYGVSFYNSAFDSVYLGTFTQSVANVWESKSITLTLDTANTWLYTSGNGIQIRITLAAGNSFQGTTGSWANATNFSTVSQCNFMSANTNVGYLRRIQFEKGIIATPFEEMSYVADLLRTQRYAWKTFNQGVAVGSGGGTSQGDTRFVIFGSGVVQDFSNSIPYPVEMRAAPAGTVYNPSAAGNQVRDASAGADCSGTALVLTGTARIGEIIFTGAIGSLPGNLAIAHLYVNARLS